MVLVSGPVDPGPTSSVPGPWAQSCSLQFAGKACANDKEIVLVAVQQHGNMLHFAAEDCKNDKEIVLAAVQQALVEDFVE